MTVSRRFAHRQFTPTPGTPGAWSPEDIDFTKAFWLADDIAQTEGSAVLAWPDRGPGNHPLGQSTGGSQPVYRTAGINGQPAVDFDGSADFMFTSSLISSNIKGSVFTVCVVDALQESALWGSVDEISSTRYMVGTLRTVASANTMASEQRDFGDASPDQNRAPTNQITTATAYFQEWRSTGSAYDFRINGASQTITTLAGSNNGDWFGDVTNRDNFSVGAQKFGTPSGFFNGKIGFVIVNDQADIDAFDRARLYEWVSAKYGITVV